MYINQIKRVEIDFVVEISGKVLPMEVKSGKKYETHRALSNIMNCEEYDLLKAIVFNNDNLREEGKFIYSPIYMVIFLEKETLRFSSEGHLCNRP